jgi:stearoyl-CoA desaturase (delta-9 desaturase)
VLVSFLIAVLVSSLVTQVTVFGTTIYLHRSQTHRSIQLNGFVAWLFRLSLWLTTGLVTREWVAIHRKHHAFTDEEGDPHSPHLEGFWSVQFGNVMHYIKEKNETPGLVDKYAKDIKVDAWDRVFFDKGLLGLAFGTTLLCVVLGIGWGLFAAALHAFMYVFVLSSSINGLCHYHGYKNFENTATNIRTIAFLTGGEGLHNNHHGYPRSPKFSFRRGEFDPAWPVIKLLTLLRLARPYKTIDEHMASAEA